MPSEAVPFVYLASVCRSLRCLISALTQVDGGGLLFRLLVPSRWGEGLVLLSPSTLLRLPAALYGACPALHVVPALRCSTKVQNKKLRLCFVPSLSERLRQPGAWWAHSPQMQRAFSPPHPQPQSPPAPVGCLCPVSHSDPPGWCRPSRISASLLLETGGLFAVQ